MEYSKNKIERLITEVSPKNCLLILQTVHKNEGITHGELASACGLLPSGLSNVIKRMQQCGLPLIEVSQKGKYRIYALPDYMKEYMDELEREGCCEKQEDEDNLFLLLQRFVEAAGEQWRERMNLLLQSDEVDESAKEGKTFCDFMRQLMNQTKQGNELVGEVRKFIGNDVLLYLVDKYMEALL